MLNISLKKIKQLESSYPGIQEQVLGFENAVLPGCTNCGSNDTADVQIGVIGRTICIASATSKFKLIPNSPRPGRYFCNQCKKFFD